MTSSRRSRSQSRNLAHALTRSCSPVLESLESRQLLSGASVERVSVLSDGTPATAQSGYAVISADANWVAFESTDDNLVAGDSNGFTDIYLHNRTTGATTRITNAHDGVSQLDQDSSSPAISADGRFVAFRSSATNLVPGDTNGLDDVFLFDRDQNTIRRLSVSDQADQANSSSSPPSISADGKYVVFHSNATNLVANDTNDASDIFLYDTDANTITLISRNTGSQGAGASYNPAISGNGNFVAFISNAPNFVAAGGDTNGVADVFVYNRSVGSIERVSIKSGADTLANQATANAGQRVALSHDGTLVVFESSATNLVTEADTNAATDVFVRNRTTNTTTRISNAAGGTAAANGASGFASISADGRYVAYESAATNLIASDGNESVDVFLFDRLTSTTRRISSGPLDATPVNGASLSTAESRFPSVSADGRYTAFFSNATNLIANDQNGVGDIFVKDRLAAPKATLSGNSVDIARGDTTPSGLDHTDFQLVDVSDEDGLTRTFTITNTGSDRLLLTGANPVTLSGANAADFTILAQPGVTQLDPGQSATFTVRFIATGPGTRTARVNVATNDPDGATYSFDVSGVPTDTANANRVVIRQGATVVAPSGTFDYGNVARNSQPKIVTFTVFNVSGETIVFDAVDVTTTGNKYEISGSLGSTVLAPGASTTFSIRLNAATAGAATATVTLANTFNSDEKTVTFNLTGNITVPQIKVSLAGSDLAKGSTVAFGSVIRNGSAVDKTFTITNSGQAPLTLGALTVPSGYSVISAPPATVAPGATATFVVRLNSSGTAGAKNGTLALITNDPVADPSFTLELTGTINAPVLSVSIDGTSLASKPVQNFGSGVIQNSAPPTKTYTITNTGTAVLNLQKPSVPNGYEITAFPASSLQPGETTTLTIRLKTSQVGTFNSNLTLQSNDPSPTFTLTLNGSVVAANAKAVLWLDGAPLVGASIPFGTMVQSRSPVSKVVTIRNEGNIPLTLGTVTLPANYELVTAPSAASLNPGADTTFTIAFTPIQAGAQSAVMTIATNDTTRPVLSAGLTANVTAAAKVGLAVDTVTLGKLPTVVLGGTSGAVGSAIVTLNNYSSSAVSGNYKITLYASEASTFVPGSKVLGNLTVKVNLKPKAKSSHTVNLKFPVPPSDGKYHVVAVVTGAKVDPIYSQRAGLYTVQIEKPSAEIAQQGGGTTGKLNSKLGQKITQSVTLKNTGNSAITGSIAGDVYLSKSGSLAGGIKVGSVKGLGINLAVKGTQKVTFSVTLPKKLKGIAKPAGTYSLILKITKVTAKMASTLADDGVVRAGQVAIS